MYFGLLEPNWFQTLYVSLLAILRNQIIYIYGTLEIKVMLYASCQVVDKLDETSHSFFVKLKKKKLFLF